MLIPFQLLVIILDFWVMAFANLLPTLSPANLMLETAVSEHFHSKKNHVMKLVFIQHALCICIAKSKMVGVMMPPTFLNAFMTMALVALLKSTKDTVMIVYVMKTD